MAILHHFQSTHAPLRLRIHGDRVTELLRLKEEGLIQDDFHEPLSRVTSCSYYRFDREIDYRPPSSEPFAAAVNHQGLSPWAGCGRIFGPDVVVGHVMQYDVRYMDAQDLISIVKMAAGGSEIYRNWSKEHGYVWDKLVERIQDVDTKQRGGPPLCGVKAKMMRCCKTMPMATLVMCLNSLQMCDTKCTMQITTVLLRPLSHQMTFPSSLSAWVVGFTKRCLRKDLDRRSFKRNRHMWQIQRI